MYERTITFHSDSQLPDAAPINVRVKHLDQNLYDVLVETPTSKTEFKAVPSIVSSPSSILSTLDGRRLRTTVVSQQPPASAVPSSTTGERLHVFHDGRRTALLLPPPKWLQTLGGDVLKAARGGLRAPMPSLVVDVRVSVGDRVEAGQAVVVLESMKTETVLRAEVAGTVKAVACRKGEMVEEGRELVEIEIEAVE